MIFFLLLLSSIPTCILGHPLYIVGFHVRHVNSGIYHITRFTGCLINVWENPNFFPYYRASSKVKLDKDMFDIVFFFSFQGCYHVQWCITGPPFVPCWCNDCGRRRLELAFQCNFQQQEKPWIRIIKPSSTLEKMIFPKLTPRVWHIPDTSTVRILGDGMPIVCPNDAFEVG